jgi:Phosphopantetheine attachment site
METQDLVVVLVGLWRSVLNDNTLEPDDNFFLVGGHSLAALRLIEAIAAATGRSVSLVLLLDNPTPASLGKCLAQEEAVGR